MEKKFYESPKCGMIVGFEDDLLTLSTNDGQVAEMDDGLYIGQDDFQ